MPARLIAAPAAEPVSLGEAKLFLRVEHADDDALISALIAAARTHVEAVTRRALMTQTWRHVFDRWPASAALGIAPAPVQSVTAARVFDIDDAPHSVDPEAFVVDTASAPGRLSFAPWSLTQPGRTLAGIEIDVIAGYGAAADAVPEPLRQAIRLLIAHWYENRGVVASASSDLPATVTALIAPYKVYSL